MKVQPNYEAIIKHLEDGTPLPSQLESDILSLIGTHRQSHESNILATIDTQTDPQKLKTYWNRIILATYGQSWGVSVEDFSQLPAQKKEVNVIPFPERFDATEDARKRTQAEIYHLGKAAEDIMSSTYVRRFKEGKI